MSEHSFGGFSTASGKLVRISDEAIQKAKSKFELCESDADGFSTARGKQIEVSEDAIQKAKAKFELTPPEGRAFSKCSGKSCDAAVRKAESMYKIGHSSTSGFSTASGKPVTVSEEALQHVKAKAMFEISHSDSEGFSSGNVCETETIQKDSLKKAFSFFDDDEDELTSSEELSPIVQWRVPLAERKINNSVVADLPSVEMEKVRRSLFQEEIIRRGPAATSTPLGGEFVQSFGTGKPGKKLYNDIYQNEDISDDCLAEDEEPASKKKKFEFDDSDNGAGVVTQEVIDSTIALLADEEKCPFNVSKCESESSLLVSLRTKNVTVPPETLSARVKARIIQQSRSKGRQLSRVKPCKGDLLNLRSDKAVTRIKSTILSHYLGKVYTEEEYQLYNVSNSVLRITPENSVEFRFNGVQFFGEEAVLTSRDGIQVADGIYLILGPDNAVGVEEVADGFMCSPGVDPRLVSHEWITNHFRWIVWTLASYERKFPTWFGGSSLNPENVLLRLKYRYDREIDLSQRSAIHRIIEQDDAASKRIILTVSSTNFEGLEQSMEKEDHKQSKNALNNSDFNSTNRNASSASSIVIELTDGWYSIPAICGNSTANLIKKGLITVGTKLIIAGAEFIGGDPCHPIESHGKSLIKFGSNSVRRARWNARLGYCDKPGPFPISISSINPEGGLVPLLHVIIARVYPVIYMCKNSDGKSLFQTQRSYEKMIRIKEMEKQSKMEKLYSEIEKEIEENFKKSKEPKRRLSSVRFRSNQLENMNTKELLNWIETHVDGATLEGTLSDEKLLQLREVRREQYDVVRNNIQREFESRLQEMMSEDPSPIPLLKVRLIDASVTKYTLNNQKNCATLSIWKPDEELPRFLLEGSCLQVFSVVPPNSFSTNSTEIRLNATRTTKFLPLQRKASDRIVELDRSALPFTKILDENFSPLFGEFDTVGLIVYITPFVPNTGQTIYFADGEKNILGVRFWAPITNQGMENVLKLHNFVAMLNLQWRKASTKCRIPSAFAQDHSVFALLPKDTSVRIALQELQGQITDIKKFAETCEMKTYGMLNSKMSTSQMIMPQLAGDRIAMTANTTSNIRPNGLKNLDSYGDPPPPPAIPLHISTRASNKFITPRRTDDNRKVGQKLI